MREIHINKIRDSIENLCIEANYNISEDIKNSLINFKEIEDGLLARDILEKIIINLSLFVSVRERTFRNIKNRKNAYMPRYWNGLYIY